MSLTSVLSSEQEPLGTFIRNRLPRAATARRSLLTDMPVRRARLPVAPGRTVVRWDLLGHAVDYRIRAAIVPPRVPDPVLHGINGAGHLRGEAVQDLGERLAEAYLELMDDHQLHRRGTPWLLAPAVEGRLAAICYAMAWFERVYREGWIHPTSPLAAVGEYTDLSWLLSEVPEYVVRDLEIQTRLAEAALDPVKSGSVPNVCVGGPTFVGSADVGGADADLLVDGLLIEIKAVSRPARIRAETFWQLAGYYLLDYADDHRIRSVGLYLSRIGWLKTWSTTDFLRELGYRRPAATLRSEFEAAARAKTAQVPAPPADQTPGWSL